MNITVWPLCFLVFAICFHFGDEKMDPYAGRCSTQLAWSNFCLVSFVTIVRVTSRSVVLQSWTLNSGHLDLNIPETPELVLFLLIPPPMLLWSSSLSEPSGSMKCRVSKWTK